MSGCRIPQLRPRRRAASRQAVVLAAPLLAALLAGSAARGESGLRLPYPEKFGAIPAATFDEMGRRVGGAQLVVERLEDGNVRLFSSVGFEGGARTVATATLAPSPGDTLRLLTEESRSYTPEGKAIGVLEIDHGAGLARCVSPNGVGNVIEERALPAVDRIANIPMNLLFLPLVRGDSDSLEFQLFFCRGGPRIVDFRARVERREPGSNGTGPLVEIRFGPDLGIASYLARPFVPRLAFWFHPDAPHHWIGHRLPLYSNGPEVFVVREGVPAAWLADEAH